MGKFLGTIFGYDSSPFLGSVVLYAAYLVLTLTFFAWGQSVSLPRLRAARTPQPELESERG